MGGLCDGDPEESFQALMDLDVCIYYTLEEIKQNQSHFVSRTPLEHLSVLCFCSYTSQKTGVGPTEKWAKSCAPVCL